MKLFAILIISILASSAYGQVKELEGKIGDVSMNSKTTKPAYVDANSPIRIIDLDKNKSVKQPAYFIDGKHFNSKQIKTINPQMIDSVYVVKEKINIDEKEYYGQVHIRMNADYKPEFITLTDLKAKYSEQSKIPSIFMIDNDIINSDYNKFLVDERFILKMEVQKIDNEDLNISVIRLITKTKENIKKANEIRIRGLDAAMSN
jgi:hypothetical protein